MANRSAAGTGDHQLVEHAAIPALAAAAHGDQRIARRERRRGEGPEGSRSEKEISVFVALVLVLQEPDRESIARRSQKPGMAKPSYSRPTSPPGVTCLTTIAFFSNAIAGAASAAKAAPRRQSASE
jgi:hypothetical protein